MRAERWLTSRSVWSRMAMSSTCTLEGMGVDAYRTKSARASYPAEPGPRQPTRPAVPARLVSRDENPRYDAPFTCDFDAPSAVDLDDLYRPPRWLTETRVAKVAYAVIIAGMVVVFVLGFRG
jgi:hypothetical protein